MPDQEPSVQERQAQVDALRGQANQALAGLRQQMAAVRDAQRQAQTVTGQARSKDGSVTVTVDSTGVPTALSFTQAALRLTPDQLAQATLATIQTAATQARARAEQSFAQVRESSAAVFAKAGAANPELQADALRTPQVPRTAHDPTAPASPSYAAAEQNATMRFRVEDQTPPAGPPAGAPAVVPPPVRPVRPPRPATEDDEPSSGFLSEGQW
jgi:DNA-binding protein YbaB